MIGKTRSEFHHLGQIHRAHLHKDPEWELSRYSTTMNVLTNLEETNVDTPLVKEPPALGRGHEEHLVIAFHHMPVWLIVVQYLRVGMLDAK